MLVAIMSGRAAGQESRPDPWVDLVMRPVPMRADARMTLRIAGAISRDDLNRYGRLLVLAAPQQLFIQEAHQRYLDAVTAILQREFPALDSLNAEASKYVFVDEFAREGITFAQVQATEAVYDLQDKIEGEQLQAEAVFIAEMESVLAAEQRARLPRVLDVRKRARCTSMAYRVIRASWIDLSSLVARMIHDPETLARVDDCLRAYEEELTPLTVALEEEMRQQDRSIPKMLAWRERDEQDQRLPEEVHRQRSDESLQIQRSIVAKGADLQQRIATLNQNTLPKLLELLPPEQSQMITVVCRETSFPAVYPDRFEAGFELCARAMEVAQLNEAQREAIKVACDAYRSSYTATCAAMEDRCRQWQEFYARTRFTLDQYEPYRAMMRELREKRWQLGLTLARQMQSLLPPGVAPDFHQEATHSRELIEYAMNEAKAPRDPYPGL